MSKTAPKGSRTILVADDVPVVRLGVCRLIEAEKEWSLVGEAKDGQEALDMVRDKEPDLLLLDLDMPKLSGLEVMEELGTTSGQMKVAVLTGSAESKDVLKSFELGARGVIAKDVSPLEIVQGIRAVFEGQYWLGGRPIPNLVKTLDQLREDAALPFRKFGLTPRESEIVAEIVKGLTNRELAEKLEISEDTIKRHLSNIFDKVGASHRLELVLFAFHHKLV
jgi:two-component system nitrate/nitrite response regulator NarL